MKKIVMLLFTLIFCFSQFNFVSANDNYFIINKTIKITEVFLDVDIMVPHFEGFSSADTINKDIKNLVADSIGEARITAKYMEELNNDNIKNGQAPWVSKVALDIGYDYFLNKDILSIQLNIYSYTGGAHGNYFVIPITINTKTGAFYEFKDLFKDSKKSIETIESKLIQTMDKNPENYFAEYKKTVKDKKGNFNFYIDGDKLVVYFGLYDIAPYAAGMHRFIFEANELKEILKDEVYNSIKDGKSLGTIRFNGSNLISKNNILDNNGISMLPLRVISESLGYKVDWNRKDGPIVGGKLLIGKDYKIKKGVTYVPLEYFTEVLKENVSLGSLQYVSTTKTKYNLTDTTIVRIFDESNEIDHIDPFYDLISDFTQPTSAIECAKIYAKAVKMRNGAIQYALLSNDLRSQKYDYFKDHIFVTGQSSPWVSSYDIKELKNNSFQVTFYLETSVPNDKITPTISNIKVIEDGFSWRISYLESNQH